MSQTLVNINTKLTTHAATAGANKFIMGYIEDVHLLRDQNTTYYPVIMVLPPILEQVYDTEIEERKAVFDISVYYPFNPNDLDLGADFPAARIAAWKLANNIGIAFITAIAGDTNITVLNDTFEVSYIPEGQNLENTVVVNYKINVKVTC